MPHGSSGAAAGLRVCVCVFFFFNVRIPANVAQIKFKLEVNRRGGGGGGGEGGGEDCFHFEIPPLHSVESHIPEPREYLVLSSPNPTFADHQK